MKWHSGHSKIVSELPIECSLSNEIILCNETFSLERVSSRSLAPGEPEDTAYLNAYLNAGTEETQNVNLKIAQYNWWDDDLEKVYLLRGSVIMGLMSTEYIMNRRSVGTNSYGLVGFGRDLTSVGLCFKGTRQFYFQNRNGAHQVVIDSTSAYSSTASGGSAACVVTSGGTTCTVGPFGWFRARYQSQRDESWSNGVCNEGGHEHAYRYNVGINTDTLKKTSNRPRKE
jgi:hypothetical protein